MRISAKILRNACPVGKEVRGCISLRQRLKVKGLDIYIPSLTAMTLGGAAQVAAAHCPSEWPLDPAVCSQTLTDPFCTTPCTNGF